MSFDMNSPNPYAPSSTPPTAPKKGNVLTYVLLGVGAVIVLGCCGCGGGFYWLYSIGAKAAASAVKTQLQADPIAQQHLGNIEDVNVDMGALMQEAGKNPNRQGQMAFKVKGSKATGIVIGRLDQPGGVPGRLQDGDLIMPSGETIKLTP